MVAGFASSAVAVMDADKAGFLSNHSSINSALFSLLHTLNDFLQKDIELVRLSRLCVLLIKSGANPANALFRKVADRCVEKQRDDGGWSDVPESMWCASLLNYYDEYATPVEKAYQWISEQSIGSRGWGNSYRDTARIPVTGLMLYLLPHHFAETHLQWLEKEWTREWHGKPCLNYKAAFTLMAFDNNNYLPEDKEMISGTVGWLAGQQNDDGGWGPWKGHPVGSDPWCTGICMVSLLQYPDQVPQGVIFNGMEWIKKKQLPNGLWSYHFIEDGSAWAFLALTKGLSILSNQKND